jgi:hypothetical protein
MGTALLFLVLLDGILLFPFTQVRLEVAVVATVLVIAAVVSIWVRNTQLERRAEAGRGPK